MNRTCGILALMFLVLSNSGVMDAQWLRQNSGISAMLTDVVMLDTATAIAVGRDGSILRTTNAGGTWINVAMPLSFIQPWNGVSFFGTQNGIIVGDNSSSVTTSNGGINWLPHSIPGRQKCLSALHMGPGNIYVGADSGWTYHSLDSGTTWSSERITAWPVRSLFSCRCAFIWGVPIYALTPYSLCDKLEFPSSSWKETILPHFQGLGSEAFSGEFCNGGGAGFIVGVQGDLRAAPTIVRKLPSDSAWRVVSAGILRDGTVYGVSAPSANVIYVCGSGGMIFKSTNGGDTWTVTSVPTTRNLRAIYFYDEKRGFAVGDSGLIFCTSNGGVTSAGDQEPHVPMKFALDQNYPNPFNGSTTIPFRVPLRTFVSLKVSDGLGREIATLVSEELPAGMHAVRWEAMATPSGVYFYRLYAGSFIETKKLVLLR
jgi:hypothetical protein